jgi:hypothetical protein
MREQMALDRMERNNTAIKSLSFLSCSFQAPSFFYYCFRSMSHGT